MRRDRPPREALGRDRPRPEALGSDRPRPGSDRPRPEALGPGRDRPRPQPAVWKEVWIYERIPSRKSRLKLDYKPVKVPSMLVLYGNYWAWGKFSKHM